MNTSCGNAVLSDSRRRTVAIAALKRARTLAVFIGLGFTFGLARAAGVNPEQPIRLDGMATQNQKLEAMSFGGAVSYGNYFAMPDQGPYEIVMNVRRPGDSKTATARFQYWYPR